MKLVSERPGDGLFNVKNAELTGQTRIDHTRHARQALAAETERWIRIALERGAGWGVWRSEPFTKDGDVFVICHRFQLLEPGASPPGAGLVFEQPNLTDGERARLLAGRYDWRENRWEDHCGVPDCGHPCCERYRA